MAVAASRGKGACRTRSGSAGAALVRGKADLLVPLSPPLAQSCPAPAFADQEPALALHELVLTAQDSIDRHEIAVLVLVLGLIFFTVVTAIMLLRTHARASAPRIQLPRPDFRAAQRTRPRQRAVVFRAASADRLAGGVGPAKHRRRSGDRRRVRGTSRARLRNLARSRQGGRDGAGGRSLAQPRRRFCHDAYDAVRTSHRSAGPRGRRPCCAAAEGRQRCQARSRRSVVAPPDPCSPKLLRCVRLPRRYRRRCGPATRRAR